LRPLDRSEVSESERVTLDAFKTGHLSALSLFLAVIVFLRLKHLERAIYIL
jgi:hypothetical protein